MAYKTITRVSVPNLKSFGQKKTELSAKKLENFLLRYMGKWAGAFSCSPSWLPQYKCIEIFKTLNSRNFCIHWCIDLKLAEIFQNGVIYVVFKFCKK